MFTTDCGLHSPEISYMVSGKNGVMTENNVDGYVRAVVNSISDPILIRELQAGARSSALRYTIENMAARFSNGVAKCLNAT
jgi:L-malate glycosyltransferase